MYCPVCFEQSLVIQQKGVVQIIVNGIQKESGRFLFFDDDHSQESFLYLRITCPQSGPTAFSFISMLSPCP